jgi:hypothetical protein
MITVKTKLQKLGDWNIVSLDKKTSSKLSSKGLVMIRGTINGSDFQTALEPDGKGGHWFNIDDSMSADLGVVVGDTLTLNFQQVTDWIEPKVPSDIKKKFTTNSKVNSTWLDITPLARWEWIRWIRSTKSEQTRIRRIEVAFSKLKAGDRRPCCFNSTQCTVPEVSNQGVLII